ncbi:MAG: RNA-binding protein [bacterium]|nr:RNA-binding protein [bacterium]
MHGTRSFLATLSAAFILGCSRNTPQSAQEPEPGHMRSTALAARTPAGTSRFVELPAERSGIDFHNRFDWGDPREHLYTHGYAGGGVAVGDVDGNGLADLYFTSQTGADRLYVQVEALRFEDRTEAAGLASESAWGTGASFADVDGDGDLDLYVCNYDAPNRLWLGSGDGRFVEAGARAGAGFSGASVAPAFADYDADGDLDLYLVTNRLYPEPGRDEPRTVQGPDGRTVVEPGFEEAFAIQLRPGPQGPEKYVVKAGQRDRLFANDGSGVFVDVSDRAGIAGNHPGLSATWWDYDRDGLPDLYVCNDFWDPDRLYHNRGDGTFEDVLADSVPHTPWFAMGADYADVDGDGHMDLLAADMSPTSHYMSKVMMGDMNESRWFLETAEPRQYMRNALYRGTGTGRFMEVSHLAGLDSSDWTWSVLFGDLDDDGRVDLFATNGTANHSFDPDLTARLRAVEARHAAEGRDDPAALRAEQWNLYRSVPPRRERNLAFRNRGDLDFAGVAGDWGLDFEGISFGAVLADLDRDGDLDVVVSNTGDPASVFENTGSGNSLLVSLEGRASPLRGEGATLELEIGDQRLVRQVFRTHGYMSASEALVHFGLGPAERAERLRVFWPSGHVQELSDVVAGQHYIVAEPGGPANEEPRDAPPARFTEVAGGSGFDTADRPERPFDDFEGQPLLPSRLSQTGPGIALGDADGDGDDDVWVGGARGAPSQVYENRGGGRFRLRPRGPWGDDRGCEDTAGLWFDADGDGDVDLFVASGSNEWAEGSPFLRDRLYLNDGDWRFQRAPFDRLPDVGDSTGAVCAADFDGDGDLDLFVGARSLPHRFPLAPKSRFLINMGGTFVDATADRAPGLGRVGLVTAALASDFDGDGDPDLIVCTEWGPVGLWRNDGGSFVDLTQDAGLSEHLGWWNGVASGDLDSDGDFDYVVTNAGWNTKYSASADSPALLYRGVFEEDGGACLVEVKQSKGGEHLLPVRGLSCSSHAMPTMRERIPTYHVFASATLEEIYGVEALGAADTYRATELASGVLWNETDAGAPRFRFEPLPRLAQASAGYGVTVGDLTGDGAADVYFVQNFFEREPETGRWDGGLSLLLAGDGRGGLEPTPVRASGLLVRGDATAAARCDLDGDGRPDLLVGRNQERVLAFRQRAGDAVGGRFVAVRLVGPNGNRSGVGARVTFTRAGGPPQTAEVQAGSGHLSQSSATLFFGLAGDETGELDVRWPDGTRATRAVSAGEGSVVIER